MELQPTMRIDHHSPIYTITTFIQLFTPPIPINSIITFALMACEGRIKPRFLLLCANGSTSLEKNAPFLQLKWMTP